MTSLNDKLRLNNNTNKKFKQYLDIMPRVNITTTPIDRLRLNYNRNRTFHLIICHYAVCHYHICCQLLHVGRWRPHDVKGHEQRCVPPHGQIPTSPFPCSR